MRRPTEFVRALSEGVLWIRESKSEEGERAIAIPPVLVGELEAHYQRTAFKGDAEFVFCHPQLGSQYHHSVFRAALMAALREAGLA